MRCMWPLAALAALGAGCRSGGGAPPPIPVAAVVDCPDPASAWSGADASRAARVLVARLVSRPWLDRFTKEKGRVPVIRVHPPSYLSMAHIDPVLYQTQIEEQLIRSGKVKIIGATTAGRRERRDQAIHASDPTAKTLRTTGSDLTLLSTVETMHDEVKGERVSVYMTTMQLVDIETNEKLWLDVHRIKKIVTRKVPDGC